MAAIGFNICIISRNKSKMEQRCKEINVKYPKVSTKYIVADFAMIHTL